MTVSKTSVKPSLSDGSPKSLLQQSARPLAGPPTPPDAVAPPVALRTMLQTLLQETVKAEFARFLGAAPGEPTTTRVGVRNGTRGRTLVTRVGKLTLAVPRDRASLLPTAPQQARPSHHDRVDDERQGHARGAALRVRLQ